MTTLPPLARVIWLAPRRALVAGVRWYQRVVSPMTPPTCRFVPTCSQYAVEAISRYGVLYGGTLALWRIARCHPLGGRGWDPPRRVGEPPAPAPAWMRNDAPDDAPDGTETRSRG